jgi:hypothetical protein
MRAILSTVTLAVGAVAHMSRAPGPFMNSHLAPLPADPASTCALAFSLGGFNFNVSSLQLPTGEVCGFGVGCRCEWLVPLGSHTMFVWLRHPGRRVRRGGVNGRGYA